MDRKIYKELLEWKEKNIDMPLMVIGARQVGKTHIIKEFCKNEFEKYIYINLFDEQNIVELFSKKLSIVEKIRTLKVIIKNTKNIDIDFENTIIFLTRFKKVKTL